MGAHQELETVRVRNAFMLAACCNSIYSAGAIENAAPQLIHLAGAIMNAMPRFIIRLARL